MGEPTITCPKCATEIKLTESLAAPLIEQTKKQFEAKLQEQQAAIANEQAELRKQQQAVEQARVTIDEQVADKLRTERVAISELERQKAKLIYSDEIEKKSREMLELQELLSQRNEKLKEAQLAQAEVLRTQRALEEEKRELELTVEKRVQESITKVRASAKAEAEEALKLKVTEKETQIAAMQRQIEELRRKAEQGSQQLQGEALEIRLEELLRSRFPHDLIEPVAKGEFGGDVLQVIVSASSVQCGSILWETKRTKAWSDNWLTKLRSDQRAAKADLAIIISQTLPKEIDTFGAIDGVWVAAPQYCVPLAVVLRQSLIEITNAKNAKEGQQTKMELVYDYLTGPRFRHRVEAIVEKFSEMKLDLDRERKATLRLWAKRETQIQGVIEATVGMYGDLQGIAGQAIKEIEGLELPLLESALRGEIRNENQGSQDQEL